MGNHYINCLYDGNLYPTVLRSTTRPKNHQCMLNLNETRKVFLIWWFWSGLEPMKIFNINSCWYLITLWCFIYRAVVQWICSKFSHIVVVTIWYSVLPVLSHNCTDLQVVLEESAICSLRRMETYEKLKCKNTNLIKNNN